MWKHKRRRRKHAAYFRKPKWYRVCWEGTSQRSTEGTVSWVSAVSLCHQVSFPFLFLKCKFTIIEQWLSDATPISTSDSPQSELHPYRRRVFHPDMKCLILDPVLMRHSRVQPGDEATPQFSIRRTAGSHAKQYILSYSAEIPIWSYGVLQNGNLKGLNVLLLFQHVLLQPLYFLYGKKTQNKTFNYSNWAMCEKKRMRFFYFFVEVEVVAKGKAAYAKSCDWRFRRCRWTFSDRSVLKNHRFILKALFSCAIVPAVTTCTGTSVLLIINSLKMWYYLT